MSEWFAAQVWSGREFLSAKHLLRRGYEVFLPSYCERRHWSDRIKLVERALFAGYVFCRFESDAVGTIVTVPGVIRLVGDSYGPSPVATYEIDAIKRLISMHLSAEPCAMLNIGQKVRIAVGPLRGIEGTVLAGKKRHKLVVSVSLLQRAIAVEIDPEWVDVPHPLLDACAKKIPDGATQPTECDGAIVGA